MARAQEKNGSWTYEPATSDQHVEGLEYTAFFGGKYQDASCSFEIYAYVFPDTETAEIYYERAADDGANMNPNFSGGMGLFGADRVVLNENTVYAVYMPFSANRQCLQSFPKYFPLHSLNENL